MEWNGRNTIAKNERNDGERKEKTREKNYNSQYYWPAAAVQFESDGVVGRANVCARARAFTRSLGRFGNGGEEGEKERLYYVLYYTYIPTDSTKYETTINNLTLYIYFVQSS